MSWIFHEPLEPAIYARRTVGPPVPAASRAFSQHARAVESLTAADVWREETEGWVTQRRAFSALVARRGFSRSRSFHSLDLWSEDPLQPQHRAFAPPPAVVVVRDFFRARAFSALDLFAEDLQPTQRRAYAPVRGIVAVIVPYSPVRRLAAGLLSSDAFDEFYPAQHVTRFSPGYAPITGDVGLSASFTFTDTGPGAFPTPTFSGTGDDPTAPVGLDADPTDALLGLGTEELAVAPGVTFSGLSASKIV